MRPDSAKLLWDIQSAGLSILRLADGSTYEDFISTKDESAADTRAAVERYFEIVGEGRRRLRDHDPDTAKRLPGLGGAIGTRNVIVHEYDEINYRLLWRTLEKHLPELLASATGLLEEYGPPGGKQ